MTDNEKLDLILSEMQGFKQKFDGLEQKFDGLEQRMDTLENEIKKINLTLENVTNRNISIVAEGHLDLSRKLDECIRLSSAVKAKQEIGEEQSSSFLTKEDTYAKKSGHLRTKTSF